MVRIEFLCSCPLQAKKRHRRCIGKNCSYLLTGRWLNLTCESFLRSSFDLKQYYRFDARNSYTVMQMKVFMVEADIGIRHLGSCSASLLIVCETSTESPNSCVRYSRTLSSVVSRSSSASVRNARSNS